MRLLVAGLIGVVPSVLAAQAAASQVTASQSGISQPGNRTYDAVVQGMNCKQKQSGRMDCEYKVGTSLRFVIAGVGQQDVAVTFYRVDEEGEYVAAMAPLHGCVVVKPLLARADSSSNLAFVSPQDGKIHRSWNTCLRRPSDERAAPEGTRVKPNPRPPAP